MEIVSAIADHVGPWSVLRAELWPWLNADDHAEEVKDDFLAGNPRATAFVAIDDGLLVGFAEATLRVDYVEGCETSPVVYLEGIFVRPAARRQGVARALVAAVADWGRSEGCTEFGSDALLENVQSHRFHSAVGFREESRIVHFRKSL